MPNTERSLAGLRSPRVGGPGVPPALERAADTHPQRMTETEFDIESRMLRGVASSVVSSGLDDAKVLRFLRELDLRLAGQHRPIEEMSALLADYALASELRAYLQVARKYAS